MSIGRRHTTSCPVLSAALTVLTAGAVFLLAGCSAGSASTSSSAARSGSASASGSAAAPAATPSPSDTPHGPTALSTPSATDSVGPGGTVASGSVSTAPAVGLGAPASFAAGVSVTIGAISAVTGTALLPGEIGGPAVSVPLTIGNGSGTVIDLDSLVVDLVDRSGVSAGQLTASPAAPIRGSVAPGASANGVYVFSLGTDDRANVSILVSYSVDLPVVLFTGTIS